MTRTNIGLLISVTFALTGGAANAAPLKSTLNESTLGSGLVQQAHVYGGTSCHAACTGSPLHNAKWLIGPDGKWHCYYYSPCARFWGRRWRHP